MASGARHCGRMEQRTKPHVKSHIQLAAALLGVDETTFVTTAAYHRTREAITDHQRTVLFNRDGEAVLPPSTPRRSLPTPFGKPGLSMPTESSDDDVGPSPRLVIEPLDPTKHERAGFSCGVAPRQLSPPHGQEAARCGFTRVRVLIEDGESSNSATTPSTLMRSRHSTIHHRRCRGTRPVREASPPSTSR